MKVHLTLVVDRSGSMGTIGEEASSGINALINEQAASDLADSITVSLWQFDNSIDKVFGPLQIQEAPIYNLVPRGMTALNDAVYKGIMDTQEWIDSLSEEDRPDKVIVSITTDGGENSSVNVTQGQVKELINGKTAEGWEFVFLASNMDAPQVASTYGINSSVTMQHTGASYTQTYSNLSAAVSTASLTGAFDIQADADTSQSE